MPYDHISLEQKWQEFWEENQIFKSKNPPFSDSKPKKYILDMFPYPSGAGLHVGHPKGYTATDIVSRFYHAKGYNVLHPMGFDAFGLPAENYAIKTGTHPAVTTAANIEVFTKQLKSLGFSYDWSREVDTTDPGYYQWTQWIFLELFKRGLAYEQDLPINYCPSCKTGLANEEVLSDNTCDRCGTLVERRPIRQWVLRITEYADRLIEDLDGLDWPEGIKEMQRNWIGKSEGCEFRMLKKVEGKPVALILHGWGDEGTTEVHFHAWQIELKRTLEQIGYEVIMPTLPNPTRPNLEEQLTFLEQYTDRLDERSMIIGHSMGGFLGMHFVEKLDKKIDRLLCVAPVFNGLINFVDWSSAMEPISWKIGSESMKRSYNPDIIRENVSHWQVFLSQNDPFILYNEAKTNFDAIGVSHVDIVQAGHFNDRDNITSAFIVPHIASSIEVYTTRVDTVYGMTYAVMAPDHPRVYDFITDDQAVECEAYITEAASRSDQERTNEGKEKTGVFTGSYVVNPYNGESVPLWIADYVLGHYGTGAVMAVPAHDERDFAFAKKYKLPIRVSIAEKIGETRKDFTPRVGVGALILNEAGEVLLQSQTSPRWEMFSTPGGGVEEGENLREALAREIREETGFFDFEIQDCIGAFEFNYFSPEREIERKLTEFTFRVVLKSLQQNELQLTDRERLLNLKNIWTSREEALKKLWQTKDFCGFPEERVLRRYFEGQTFCDDGILVNSGEYDGLSSAEARRAFIEKSEKEGFGRKKVNYKLRDWLFSRQRYWGEPIPLIHLAIEDVKQLPHISDISQATDTSLAYILKREPNVGEDTTGTLCHGKVRELIIGGKVYSKIYDGINSKIVIDSNLPLMLPEVEKYEPAGDGQSPLATVPSFVNIPLATNLTGKRETNTMPQWGGSCWYYLRYMDVNNREALAGKEALEYWQNVDEYVGGAEHAVLHLLYARFWHKVLYDIGVVPTKEPFQKLTNVGLILGPDGNKMSKSKGNVINPNDVVAEYGADTLRLYEMNMAAFTDPAPWNTEAIVGVRRFLDKAYATFEKSDRYASDDMKAMKLLHKTVKKISEDIVEYKFNTAISSLMILLNEGLPQDREFQEEWKEKFAILLHPFAPHMAEELWNLIGKSGSIYNATWPEYDDFMLVDDEVTIAVQIGGKLRGTFTFLNGVAQEEVSEVVRADEGIAKWLEGKEIVKEIFIPNKMLSIVVRDK